MKRTAIIPLKEYEAMKEELSLLRNENKLLSIIEEQKQEICKLSNDLDFYKEAYDEHFNTINELSEQNISYFNKTIKIDCYVRTHLSFWNRKHFNHLLNIIKDDKTK